MKLRFLVLYHFATLFFWKKFQYTNSGKLYKFDASHLPGICLHGKVLG